MSNIIVPIKFSTSSKNSLRYAVELARNLKTKVTLYHCYSSDEHNRIYDFEPKNYRAGILAMLAESYRTHINQDLSNVTFVAHEGSLVERLRAMSKYARLIVLGSNKFSSHMNRWLGSKSSKIASLVLCPVLIIPESAKPFVFKAWNTIWHIKRGSSENEIISKFCKSLNINETNLIEKSLNQSSFKSLFWKSLVNYSKHKIALKKLLELEQAEHIDLFILVSHGANSFQKFVKEKSLQIIFSFHIPVLVFPDIKKSSAS